MKFKSKIETVENDLRQARRPLHISEIIEMVQKDSQPTPKRDSAVSILTKKIKAGLTFKKNDVPYLFQVISDRFG